jgi:hypothetical protein
MAKQRWVTLAMEEKRQVGNSGPFGLIEVMKTPEIDAAGITCTVEMPEGRIDVGPQGQISWKHLQALTQNVEEAKSLFRVMANFRGSIIGITEKEEKPDGAAQNEE